MTDPMTPTAIDLEGLRALLERATPGEWRVVDGDVWDVRVDGEPGVPLVRQASGLRSWGRRLTENEHAGNVALIVALKNALPALLALAERAPVDIEAAFREGHEAAACQGRDDPEDAWAKSKAKEAAGHD